MEAEAGALRRLLQGSRPARNSEGYPPELRTRVGSWLAGRRAEGRSWTELSQVLGISATTARSWGESARASGFVEVQTTPQFLSFARLEDAGLTLVTPRGYRVEGLRPADLLALLEQLG